jgi:hypothetical protein
MSPDFQYPKKQAELWLLLTSDPPWPMFQKFRIADALSGLGRLKPGRSIEQARAKMKVVCSKLTFRNLTNHNNPLQVHNNIADPLHGSFFGNYGRHELLDFGFSLFRRQTGWVIRPRENHHKPVGTNFLLTLES